MDFLFCPQTCMPAGGLPTGHHRPHAAHDVWLGNTPYRFLVFTNQFGRYKELVFGAEKVLIVGQFILEDEERIAAINDVIDRIFGCFIIFRIAATGEFQIITDVKNSIPCYKACHAGRHFVASRVDWVLYCSTCRAAVNQLQILSYVFGGLNPGSGTFFHDVDASRPGTSYVFRDGSCRVATSVVWDPFRSGSATTPNAASTADILLDGARRWMGQQSHVVCDVTGGLDSRMSLAVYSNVARGYGLSLVTQTIGSPHSDEVGLARAVARAAGCAHRVLSYDQEEDLLPIAGKLHGAEGDDPMWSQTSGQSRHAYIYYMWLAEAMAKEAGSTAINSLGGELAKGIYYAKGKENISGSVGIDKEVERAIEARTFQGEQIRLLREVPGYFIKEGYKEVPHGLAPEKMTDWWAWRNRFARGWSSRYHMTLKFGYIHYPLAETEFLCHVLPARSEILSGGRLHRQVTELLSPELTKLPYRSSHQHNWAVYRPSVLHRAMKRLARSIGRPIMEPGDPFFFRRLAKEDWRQSSERLAETLPLFRSIGQRIVESDVLIGGSADMRLYYVTRFLDDLISGRGIELVPE